MTNRTKITIAAALIAAFATPALAQGTHTGRHHARHELSSSAPAPRFVEGRNAAVFGYVGGTHHEPLVPDRVNELGN
jgi:hypothetical protein